MVSVLYIKRTE